MRLKRWRLLNLQQKPRFKFYHLDILNQSDLDQIIDEAGHVDAIINLAARAGVRYSVENPWIYLETNITGTLNLLEQCRKRHIHKFVVASSSSLYGKGNVVPYREDQPTDNPLSPYAASKKATELLCHSYHHLHGLDITIFRYFSVYGPACRPDMSPFRFVQWISEGRPVKVYGDGQQSRDFTYIDDIARGTVAGLCPMGYEVVNLGSDRPVVLSTMIQMIEEMVGKKAIIQYQPAHAADVLTTWADVSKAKRLLAWHSEVDFNTGLSHLVKWYQDNRDWAKEIVTD